MLLSNRPKNIAIISALRYTCGANAARFLSKDCETYFYSERMERVEMTENEIILHDYLREIEKYYKLGIAKEHSYRSTLQTMIPSWRLSGMSEVVEGSQGKNFDV